MYCYHGAEQGSSCGAVAVMRAWELLNEPATPILSWVDRTST